MEVKKLICINCPMGCPLEVEMGDEIKVSGNTCPRGEDYAKKEVTNPTRIVTSTVQVENGEIPMVSVKTQNDIPKGKIFTIMEEIEKVTIKAPVAIGDIVIENCADTGVNIIATKNVKCKE